MTLDVGGTTTKIGLISDGKPVTSRANDIFGIPLKLPLMDLHSIALGGGTVARVGTGSNTKIALGPKSMGSYPGPACYDLGGTEATLTDALLALKYLDPDYFAGGTRKLNVAKAEEAIQEKVAHSPGTNMSEAASRIMDQAITMIAEKTGEVCDKKEIDPKDFSLFAFGGNGGILGCYVAERIGINRVYIFSVSPVFSAFGSSTADISHTYEYASYTPLEDFSRLKEIVSGLQEEALRDMKGEGLNLDEVQLGLTFEISDGKKPPVPIETAYLEFNSINDVEQVRGLFDKVTAQGYARDKLLVELVTLRAWCTTRRYEPPVFEIENSDSTGAIKGEREPIWAGNAALTSIYDWNLLKSGNVLAGPAIVESNDISYLVPIGWTLTVDQYKNALIERGE
jgi:N-methylhydantoinase A/oxoprolinase/acetone carboxylase beta subunit